MNKKNAPKTFVQNPSIRLSEYGNLVSLSEESDFIKVTVTMAIGQPEEVQPPKGAEWKGFAEVGSLTLDETVETPWGPARWAVIKGEMGRPSRISLRLVTSKAKAAERLAL